MAKPIPVAARDGAISPPSHPAPTRTYRARRRPPRPRPHPAPSAPSKALLSALASIVASSPVVASSPSPLPFLCPSLAQTTPPSQTIFPRSTPPPPRPRPDGKPRIRPLPLKFEPGDDGRWRKVEVYTLYGSTVCSSSCREPTNAASSGDTSIGSTTHTSATTTGAIDLSDSLPVGWNAATMRSESRTTLILALSLVLASFICFFIVGCLFWRKNVRRKHKAGDVEMKARRKSRPNLPSPSPAPSLLIEAEKGPKKKIWAKATARWKANARYIARQRRGKRPSSIRSQTLDSTTTLHPSTPADPPDDNTSSSLIQSPLLHTTLSRRPSSESLQHESSPLSSVLSGGQQQNVDNLQQPSPTSINDSSNDDDDPPSLPPAYRQGSLATPNNTASPGTLSISDDHMASSLLVPGPRLSRLCTSTSSLGLKSSSQSQQTDSPQISYHAAHVATDDKALLARLADLAERPPDALLGAESSHQLSVPIWQDEQLEDFAVTTAVLSSSGPNTSGSTPHPQLPPPPSKGKMAESSFYAYRYSFEEFSESIEPILEPSAPPFEAPGAPVTNDMVMLAPSAPPLLLADEEDEFMAPGFQANGAAGDAIAGAGGDVGQSSSDRAEGDRNRNRNRDDTSSSRPRSNGTLPGYHP